MTRSAPDWKRLYRDEAASARGLGAIDAALGRWAAGDPRIVAGLQTGGIVSFPHTTLADSAEPLARTAASIVAGGFTRVVALGVLHTGTLPEPERALAASLASGGEEAEAAFARLRGAFVAEPVAGLGGPHVRVDPALLANEFSLDLFRTVLAAAAARSGRAAPEVAAVFVGATRSPNGAFATGEGVAAAVRKLLAPGVALVATGDLVHFGNGYSTPAEMGALTGDASVLAMHFETRVRAMLETAFARGDVIRAWDASTRELRSDQRNLLPVLARLVGPGARPELVSFRLSDYSGILGEPPPCVVGAALVALRRR